MKIFRTEIWIDREHRWWFGEQPIENEGVVKFFKMNLHYDGDYFLFIKSRDGEEKGYLKSVEGFPLLCENIEFSKNTLTLFLDNGKKQEPEKLYYDEEKNYFWSFYYDEEYKTYIPFLLTSRIVQLVSPYIHNHGDSIVIKLDEKTIPVEFKKVEFPVRENTRL